MNNKNDRNNILKNYIIKRYGGIAKFLKKEKFPQCDLETVLQKNDIFYEIGIGLKICGFLNIDAERLFCHSEILELERFEEKPDENIIDLSLPLDDIIKEKYANLSDDDRKKVLEYADYIFETGNGEA